MHIHGLKVKVKLNGHIDIKNELNSNVLMCRLRIFSAVVEKKERKKVIFKIKLKEIN